MKMEREGVLVRLDQSFEAVVGGLFEELNREFLSVSERQTIYLPLNEYLARKQLNPLAPDYDWYTTLTRIRRSMLYFRQATMLN